MKDKASKHSHSEHSVRTTSTRARTAKHKASQHIRSERSAHVSLLPALDQHHALFEHDQEHSEKSSSPSVAVVCGAHTELGKSVVHYLLGSEQIASVVAIAEVDCRDSIRVRRRDEHKFQLIVDNLDFIERIISTHVVECDLAFCCLGSSKEDFSHMGSYAFHKVNVDIPSRFIREMFEIGTLRVAVLSCTGADSKSKRSEYLRVKGELEDFLSAIHEESCGYGPVITLFKVPRMLTNLKDQNGVRGHSISKSHRLKETAAVKFNSGPAHAIHVRDVAKAMCFDLISKVGTDMETGVDVRTLFIRQRMSFITLKGPEILALAEEARTHEHYKREVEMQNREVVEKLSPFSKHNILLDIAAKSRQRYQQHDAQGDLDDDFIDEDSETAAGSKMSIIEQVRAEHAQAAGHDSAVIGDFRNNERRRKRTGRSQQDGMHANFGNDFDERLDRGRVQRDSEHIDFGDDFAADEGSPPGGVAVDFGTDFDDEEDVKEGMPHANFGEDFRNDEVESEHTTVRSDGRLGGIAERNIHGSGSSIASSVQHMGSVESLGLQISRPLTNIVDNGILPDVEDHSLSHTTAGYSQSSNLQRRTNRTGSESSHRSTVISGAGNVSSRHSKAPSRHSEIQSIDGQSLESPHSLPRSHRSSYHSSVRASSSHRNGYASALSDFDEEERQKFFMRGGSEVEGSVLNMGTPSAHLPGTTAGTRTLHNDKRYFRRENHPAIIQDQRDKKRSSQHRAKADMTARPHHVNRSSVAWDTGEPQGLAKFSTFAAKVIAATDRPSTRRAHYQSRSHGSVYGYETDMRPLGNTAI